MTESNQSWISRLDQVECRDATYKPKSHPLVFAKAQGSIVTDSEGKDYIDLCAGFGALALGHHSEALHAVLTLHMDGVVPPVEHAMGDVYPSEEKILFLETMQRMLPVQFAKGALALSGGQAVEIALKTAMLATKRSGFIVFDEGYHGLDLGVLPLTSREDFRAPFTSWTAESNVVRLPYGASRELLADAAKSLSKVGLAAIIVEPVQGRAGVRPAPAGWLSTLREMSRAHGGLLILDEIFTGFGRTGQITVGGDVDADILCFGKAIGGGFPISACFAKKDVMDAWPQSTGEALHTGTFFGHPFSASVGRRTLEILMRHSLAERAQTLGAWARQELAKSLKSCPYLKNIRGLGLMIGVEFTVPGYAAKLMDDLRPFGVIALPSGSTGSTLSITPALNIPQDILASAIERIAHATKSQ